MQPVVHAVIEHLDGTTRLYEEILEAERHKQRAIVGSRIEELLEVVAREEELVAQSARFEAERLGLSRQIGQTYAALGPTPRLTDLIGVLESPARAAVAARRERLLDLGRQINEVNRTNFHLLRGSLAFLRECLETVFGGPAGPQTYTASGREEAAGHEPTRVDHLL